ncbi:MAG: transcription-repair coupling factor (superfamily II helicase), partial [Cognaticolwellia sp.]
MSKNVNLFSPILAKSRGKNADKKVWQNLPGSSATVAVFHGALSTQQPILLLTHDTPSALRLEQELASLNRQAKLPICLFPDWETLPYDTFSPHQDIISQRLATLYQLSRMDKGIVIVPISTLIQRLAPKQYIEANSLIIKKGDKKDLHQLRQNLEASGYRCVDQVMEHGEFSARGAILDIFPMGSITPFRLDFFDDEIDEIRLFYPENQRSSDKVEGINLLPAHEFPTDTDGTNLFRSQYREQFTSTIDKESIYHQVSNGIMPAGIEYYLPLFFEQTNTLCDYLADNTLVIISGDIDKALAHYWTDIDYRYEDRRYDPTRPLLPPSHLFLNSEELYSALKPFDRINLKPEVSEDEVKTSQVQFDVHPLPDLTIDHKLKQPFELLNNFVANKETPNKLLFVAES